MKQMQNRRRKTNGGLCRRLLVLALLVGLLANTVGCAGGQSSTAQDTRNGSAQATETSNVAEQNTAASIVAARNLCGSLSYEGRDTLSYAEQFTVDRYEDGYVLLTIAEDARYLVIPEGKEIPEDLPGDVVPLCQPISHIYLVASAAMDMFVKLDALDAIQMAGQFPRRRLPWRAGIFFMRENIPRRIMRKSYLRAVILRWKIPWCCTHRR